MKKILVGLIGLLILNSELGCSKDNETSPNPNSPNNPGTISNNPNPTNNSSGGISNPTSMMVEDAGTLSGMDAAPPPHCGDPGLPKCELGEGCRSGGDCSSKVCDDSSHCIEYPSCAGQYGGRTCGLGEVDDPNNQNESCCVTDYLPQSKVKIDRYLITQGRIRRMIEATNGDFLGWYNSNRASLPSEATAELDPYASMLPSGWNNNDYSILASLSSGVIAIPDKPSNEQGCQTKTVGTHFWFSDSDNAVYGDGPNGFSQQVMDTKPINCVSQFILQAFCMWDGGRLQSIDEANESFGATLTTHPFDNAGGWGSIMGGWGIIGPSNQGTFDQGLGACPTCTLGLINWANVYTYPAQNPTNPNDYSFYVSAPGRFKSDTGPFGTKDVAGDDLTWTSSPANWLDDHGRTTIYLGLNGSWEGHNTVAPALNNYYAFNAAVRYGKISGRCIKY